jgi:molybdenum cofactor cytidylyltransferase
MITAEAVAVVLLAAGRSTRFGSRDKLAAPLGDLPLGLHAARMLAALPFAARIAVVGPAGPDVAAYGFEMVVNADRDVGQSRSIRLGLARARPVEPEAVLIVLADMPFVSRAHIEALMARFDGTHDVVGSTDGHHRSPPVLIGAARFPTIAALSGDAGARTLLQTASVVAASPAELADVDTLADLLRVSS